MISLNLTVTETEMICKTEKLGVFLLNVIQKASKTITCEINNKIVTSKYAVYKTNSLWQIVQCNEEFIYTVSA